MWKEKEFKVDLGSKILSLVLHLDAAFVSAAEKTVAQCTYDNTCANLHYLKHFLKNKTAVTETI